MKVTEKAQQALDGILSAFESGQVPEAIAHSAIPTFDVPCNKWSINNRRFEDTDGKPLDVPQIDPPEPPPLLDIALSWGIAVKYMPFFSAGYGFYSPGRQEIGLCTHDEEMFFHELSHAAHDRIAGGLKAGQDWKQEIVAELTAATLLHLFGKRPNDGEAYRYIRHYAEKAGKDAHRACLSVIADVGKCLNMILNAHTAPVIETIAAD